MRLVGVALALSLMLAAATALAQSDPASLSDRVRRIVEESDPARRVEILQDLSAWDAMPLAELRKALRAAVPPTGTAGSSVRPLEVGDLDTSYRVLVPPEYNPAKAWPVMIAMHGPSIDGDEGVRLFAMGAPDIALMRDRLRDKMKESGQNPKAADTWVPKPPLPMPGTILVSPFLPADDPQRPGYPLPETCERIFQAMMRDLCRTWNVDTRRVTACGLSQGACFSWYLACYRPDQLAGAVAVAGIAPDDPTIPCLMNTLNVGIYLVHGLKDPETSIEHTRRPAGLLKEYGHQNFTVRELPDLGHGWPKKEFSGIREWILRQRREPFPAEVRYVNPWWTRNPPGRAYWVELLEGDYVPRIEARRDGNAITVTTQHVKRLALRLNEDMVDLSKDVTVTLNGREVYRGTPARTARQAVETFLERWDAESITTARIEMLLR